MVLEAKSPHFRCLQQREGVSTVTRQEGMVTNLHAVCVWQRLSASTQWASGEDAFIREGVVHSSAEPATLSRGLVKFFTATTPSKPAF